MIDSTPLRGVSVIVKSTSANTVTDNNGAFTLLVPPSATTLVVSNIDYIHHGYKGLDLEVKTENASGGNILFGCNLNGSNNQAYIDGNYGGQAYYPGARTFSLGVNVTLKQ